MRNFNKFLRQKSQVIEFWIVGETLHQASRRWYGELLTPIPSQKTPIETMNVHYFHATVNHYVMLNKTKKRNVAIMPITKGSR